jgi:hypothetical protein
MLILILLLMIIFLIRILSYRTVRTIIFSRNYVLYSTLRNGFFADNNDHLSHSLHFTHVHV